MNFNNNELENILKNLMALPAETEVFEFKEANNNYDFHKIGKYFSALANEANLKGQPWSWLIFGIQDKKRKIIGSNYRKNRKDLDSLKKEIAGKTTNGITFIEIYELNILESRIVMFQIPAAPKGFPIAFEGHYYGRNSEDLSPLNIEELERIRSQLIVNDWSAGVCSTASINDLDPKAVLKARENFKSKFPEKSGEVDLWDDSTFLNKAHITIKGQITRTAVILLGREESEHFISPGEAKIRWVLKDLNNIEKDYEIFKIPLLLSIDGVFLKIRNLKYRYMKEGTLFPEEIQKYEPFVIREAINNCIAHQDYQKSGRINVIEIEDEQLVFTNYGQFIPGSIEKVVFDDAPEEQYRNPFLVTAMFNLKMVDTAGGGIKKMFNYQRQRFFPMPEYDLSSDKVKLTVTGKVIDIAFAKVLARNPDLSLHQIIALDKVQKQKDLSVEEVNYLKKKKLIEGRKPNYIIAADVVSKTSDGALKAQYIKHKGFNDSHYKKMIIKYLETYNEASRKDIDQLILDKLPAILSTDQKYKKVGNLLTALRLAEIIRNVGNDRTPKWILLKK